MPDVVLGERPFETVEVEADDRPVRRRLDEVALEARLAAVDVALHLDDTPRHRLHAGGSGAIHAMTGGAPSTGAVS